MRNKSKSFGVRFFSKGYTKIKKKLKGVEKMEERNIRVVVYNYDHAAPAAEVFDLKHGVDQSLGLNIVAVVEGDLCSKETQCSWCNDLSKRIASRTRTKNIEERYGTSETRRRQYMLQKAMSEFPRIKEDVMRMEEIQSEAFWSKVEVAQSKTVCWNWMGAKKPTGYGNVGINKKDLLAHRVAWELCNFKIPDGYIVMHLCDNPACCNPGHLVLGTNQTNICDMIIKNRQEFHKNKAIGSKNGNSVLTEDKVLEIRSKYPSQNQYELAKEYGVSQATIGSVIRRLTWRHVKC